MKHDQNSPEAETPVLSEVEGPSSISARRDGWTPFARRLFLEVLAETGRVSRACEYAQLTKQSAYALRARDPLFAASWDAACELARIPLADALYEKALDGVTETITKDGEVVVERYRYDSRLSIAVLNRLDKRCDRARETGANHLHILRHWDQWITLVGRGEELGAQALLEIAPHGQLGQLPLVENPTEEEKDDESEVEEVNLWDRCWKTEDGWMTKFPPPPGFDGWRQGEWHDYNYERACTPEEAEILEASEAAADASELSESEQLRDEWFALLRARNEEASAPTNPPADPA